MIKSKEITLVKIDDLVPYSKNMNKHTPEQIDRLVKLIEYQGFRDPIIAQKGTNKRAGGYSEWERVALTLIYTEQELVSALYASLNLEQWKILKIENKNTARKIAGRKEAQSKQENALIAQLNLRFINHKGKHTAQKSADVSTTR